MGNDSAIDVDPGYLAGLVRRVLGDQAAQTRAWEVEELKGGLEYASAVYRLQGSVDAGGRARRWSLILKVVRPDARFDEPQGYNYWKREVQAYRSGLFQKLPAQVAAPYCYGVGERPDGSVWVWLEDVDDPEGHPWSLERYAQVARGLGQFNGAYLAGRSLPDNAWITRDWLHKYLEHAAPMVAFVRQHPTHPLVLSMLPGIALPLTLALWEERTRMLRVLDGLPQTFCHQDAFGRNLFYRRGQVVALDWGYAGIAPVGAELAPLIGCACSLARVPSSQAHELDRACFEAYLEGLQQAGWVPDRRQIRLAYTLTLNLRYVLGATVGEMLPGLLEEETRSHWIEGLGGTPEKVGETDAGIAAYYQSVAVESLRLLGPGMLLRILFHTARYAVRLAARRRRRTPG
jgi:hypothetical protein